MGWFLVMFDLPVGTKKERRIATRFRNTLLDNGYLMLQFSVYARCAVTIERRESLVRELKKIAPGTGHIHCLFITDAQWKHSTVIRASEQVGGYRINEKSNIGEQLQFW